MKQKTVLSALLLSSTLSAMSTTTFAQLKDVVFETASDADQRITLESKKTINIKGVEYRLSLQLMPGVQQGPNFNKITFAMSGVLYMWAHDKDGKVYSRGLDGEYDETDGHVLFELANEDENGKDFLIFQCSSTWNSCSLPEGILSFNKKTNEWSIRNEVQELELELIAVKKP